MAVLDANLMFAGSYATGNLVPQLITAIGATAGANVVDLAPSGQSGNQLGDFGNEEVSVIFQVKNTLTSGGAATVQFQLVQADDAALTTNVQVLNQTDAFPYTILTAGTWVPLGWPKLPSSYAPKRYAGIRVVIGTAILTNATGWLIAAVGDSLPGQPIAPIYKTTWTIQ